MGKAQAPGRVLIVGAAPRGQRAARVFLRRPDRRVVGFLDSGAACRCLPDDLGSLACVVDPVPAVRTLRIESVEGGFVALAELGAARARSATLKRIVDLALAVALLVMLSPLFVVLAAIIRVDSRGPVLFRQIRMGFGERRFTTLKFRTMVDGAHARLSDVAHLNVHTGDARFFKAADDPRTTRVGRWLRRLALDELPQLANVVAGDMSLVGPRPLMLEEDRHVVGDARRRLAVRPGMTGLWQVLGGNDVPFDEMLLLDRLYAATGSLALDARILLRTPAAILRRRRAY